MLYFGYAISETSDRFAWYAVDAIDKDSARDMIESQVYGIDFDGDVAVDIMEQEEAADMTDIPDLSNLTADEVNKFYYGS